MVFLETTRLYMRPPCKEDFQDLYQLQSDPEVMRYIGEGIRDKDTVRRGLQQAIDHQKKHGFSLGSVFDKHSDTFIGRAGLIHIGFQDENDIEIAYAFHKAYWKKGYATEIAQALLIWGFSHLPYSFFVALVHPDNQSSRQVLEKMGMHYMKQVENKVYYQIQREEFGQSHL